LKNSSDDDDDDDDDDDVPFAHVQHSLDFVLLTNDIAGSNMEGWSGSSSIGQPQREEDKLAQFKLPVNQAENEIGLTIQGQRTVQDIVDKATELFRRLQNVKLSGDTVLRQQTQSREIRDNLNTLQGLFVKLRNLFDETKRRVNVPPGERFEVCIDKTQEPQELQSNQESLLLFNK
jgi:hypothetical protein